VTSQIVGHFALEPARVRELAAVQQLAVQLFFCDALVEDLRRDRAAVLDRHGVSERLSRALPAIDSASFKAESFGRRILIARELNARFKQTFAHLCGAELRPDQLVAAPWFGAFLSSDYFFRPPRASVPHAYGIGPGYDNVNKLWPWLVATHQLRSPGCDPVLRELANTEFGVHLVSLAHHASDDAYAAFSRGVYCTLERKYLVIVPEPLRIGKFEIASCIDPKTSGLCDLDALPITDDFV
jgi:hypothetical protein